MSSEDHIDYREVRPGFAVSLDVLPGGQGVIAARVGGVGTAWEYSSSTAATHAWLAWRPESNMEPRGFAMRRDLGGNHCYCCLRCGGADVHGGLEES